MSGEARNAGPFSPRVALVLVVGGIAVFFLVLWLIGSGMSDRQANDGGSHAAAKGLTGYAAFAQYLGKRGYGVSLVKSPGGLHQPGALILTPPAYTDTKQLQRVVDRHRSMGPTLIVVPKWAAYRIPMKRPDVKAGWVELGGPQVAEWKGFYDDIVLSLDHKRTRQATTGWTGAGLNGQFPDPRVILTGSGAKLIPLVETSRDGRILAAYVADGGDYPGLRDLSQRPEPEVDKDDAHGDYPVIFIFDPDLIDNYGLSHADNALLGERIVAASLEGGEKRVAFDLTLNGFGRSRSLLSLAFEPPFLAATLCLMLAVLVLGWRAFNRFGPALLGTRALAFGKRALVANAAGLIRRTRRLHLIGRPYADACRDRLIRALALPTRLGANDAELAIDRALHARDPDAPSFAVTAAALRTARRPIDMLRAARTLHSLERTLTK
ncbi:MAG: DUF4350 domain-containing protein [Sphingomonadales bacterium]|nr:DUF4350 domain-containing protein [Sphingomonadales bacterium]